MADPTDVIERAQAWLAAADERGINRTDRNGYLAVIEDLIAEVEFQQTALQGYRNRQIELTDTVKVLLLKGELLAAVVQGAKEEFVRVPYGASHEDVAAINDWHRMADEALKEWQQ